MLTLYIVRHGETEGNRKDILMGQIDTPLTDTGVKNAAYLADKFKGVKFDKVFSSDLGRAFITAHIISKKLNIEPYLESVRDLRELDCGIYTHKKLRNKKRKDEKNKDREDFQCPMGESYINLQKRAIKFINKLEKKYNNKTVLIVTHAGTIKAIKCFYKIMDFSNYFKSEIPHHYAGKFVIDNGKLVKHYETHK